MKQNLNRERTSASKFLSLVLRHHPEVARITLDHHGRAEVDALIAGVNAHSRHHLTRETLQEKWTGKAFRSSSRRTCLAGEISANEVSEQVECRGEMREMTAEQYEREIREKRSGCADTS